MTNSKVIAMLDEEISRFEKMKMLSPGELHAQGCDMKIEAIRAAVKIIREVEIHVDENTG